MHKPITAVYSITHLATGRVYIGSSIDARKRMAVHRWLLDRGEHHSIHLQRAWILYGKCAFAFAVIEIVRVPSALLEREQFWMDRMQACHPTLGFNIAPVAGTRARIPHSVETRQKMSLARKGKPKSAEHRAKIGIGNTGKKRTDEVKRRTAETVRLQANTPERIEKSRAGGKMTGGWNKGMKFSPLRNLNGTKH